MANSADIVGYSYSGALYCPEHKPRAQDAWETPSPVFLDDAVPGWDVCDVCVCVLVEK